jgi:hypothetical protein
MSEEQKKFLKLEDLTDRANVDEFDPAEDAFERSPTPQPGWQQVKLGWQDKEEGTIAEMKDKESGQFRGYMLYCTCTILQGDDKGAIYNVYPSTTLRRGKAASEISTILAKMGLLKKKGNVKHEALVALFVKLVNKGLILWNELDWRGSRKVGNTYVDELRSKHDFERDKKTGKYKERMIVTKGGETIEILAQVQSRNWSVNQPDLKKDDEKIEDDGEMLVDETEGAKVTPNVKGLSKAKEETLEDNDNEEILG